MALDVGVELGREEGAAQLVALQLGHVDAVGREPAERLVQRGRDVADPVDEARDDRAGADRRHVRLARQHQEPGGVVVLVLDVLGQDVQPVQPGGGTGATARRRWGRAARPPRGRRRRCRRRPPCAQPCSRMILRHWPSAWTWLRTVRTSVEIGARDRHQLEVDRQEVLADDVQARLRQQVVDVRHPAGDRVVDRDHRQSGPAGGDRLERVLERRTGQLVAAGEHLGARRRRVGTWLTLVCDRSIHVPRAYSGSTDLLRSARGGPAGEFLGLGGVEVDVLLAGQLHDPVHDLVRHRPQDQPVALHPVVAGEVQRLAELDRRRGERGDHLARRGHHVGADHRRRE